MLSRSKCSDYIDSLVQMDILKVVNGKDGVEKVELKVPLEELLREGMHREGANPPSDRKEFPQWISLLLSRTVVREKELFFSKEELVGLGAIFMSLICLAYGDDALVASLKLFAAAGSPKSATRV